jgi:hypothetical protein
MDERWCGLLSEKHPSRHQRMAERDKIAPDWVRNLFGGVVPPSDEKAALTSDRTRRFQCNSYTIEKKYVASWRRGDRRSAVRRK